MAFWNSTKNCTALEKTFDNFSAEQHKLQFPPPKK